ncbi:hypothetical protein BC829DRAFT_384457 [Chytridium lagenaria]|nr:hypothetical protein BC829DRAFT_384457 [Chytridium lagenaria]
MLTTTTPSLCHAHAASSSSSSSLKGIQRILSMPKYANHSFIDYFIDQVHQSPHVTLFFRPHHLRHSAEAARFSLFRYQFIPDERFSNTLFLCILLNTPHLSQRLINSNKHYLSFPHNSYHPKQLDLSDIDEIGDGNSENERDDPRFLF